MSAQLDAAMILGLVTDISRHDQAAPLILGQGRAAVPTLIRFLDGAPVSVPHAGPYCRFRGNGGAASYAAWS